MQLEALDSPRRTLTIQIQFFAVVPVVVSLQAQTLSELEQCDHASLLELHQDYEIELPDRFGDAVRVLR